jgi:transcriptional regulator with XRE-family HTH domain
MQGSLARRLRILRAERGMTMREAADLVNVRPATLSDIEHGRSRPHDVTLAKIAEGYGVPVEDLIEESEPVPLGEAPSGMGRSPEDPSRTSPEALEEVSEEERLSLLEGWQNTILALVDKLEEDFEAVQESGDREDLLTLFSEIAFLKVGSYETLGTEEVMQEREGVSDKERRERNRAWRALLRLDALAEDVEEAVDNTIEEKSAAITRIADFRRRRAG